MNKTQMVFDNNGCYIVSDPQSFREAIANHAKRHLPWDFHEYEYAQFGKENRLSLELLADGNLLAASRRLARALSKDECFRVESCGLYSPSVAKMREIVTYLMTGKNSRTTARVASVAAEANGVVTLHILDQPGPESFWFTVTLSLSGEDLCNGLRFRVTRAGNDKVSWDITLEEHDVTRELGAGRRPIAADKLLRKTRIRENRNIRYDGKRKELISDPYDVTLAEAQGPGSPIDPETREFRSVTYKIA